MLTLEELKNMKPDTIFCSGVIENSSLGIFMTRDGGMLRWIAIRGYKWDWAIYLGWEYRSKEWLMDHGDKVHDKKVIRRLIPCSDEAFKMYRY